MTKSQTFKLSSDAKVDLIYIRQFTKKTWGSKQSLKYLNELKIALQNLSENPNIGKQRAEVGANVYSFPYASHVIYYILINRQMIVFGVLHKSMLPTLHLKDRNAE